MRRKLQALTVLLLLVQPGRVQASIFGEENATLGLILTQVTDTAVSVRDNLSLLRENTQLAADSAAFAREMVQVGKNVVTIAKNPREFLAYMTRSWYRAFPEMRDVLDNIHSVRQSMYEATHPSEMPQYDDMAYVNAFDRMVDAHVSGYEVWAHAVDRWGINGPHDEAIEAITKQREVALDNFTALADVLNSTGLSPARASVYTAHSTTVTALAATQSAASLESIVRTMELVVTGMEASNAAAYRESMRQERGAGRIHTGDWDLDPMQGRREIRWK